MGTDHELLAAWKQGDKGAGNRFVRRHFDRVYHFFATKLDQQLEDLTQRTFLRCLERADRVRPDASPRAFLLGIARHVLLEHFRERSKRNRSLELDEASMADIGESPSRVLALREEQAVVLDAMRLIPVDLQIALELYYWEDLTMVEMAQVLEIPHGTVKSRLHRAKKLLKEKIDTMTIDAAVRESTLRNLDEWARGLPDSLPSGSGKLDG